MILKCSCLLLVVVFHACMVYSATEKPSSPNGITNGKYVHTNKVHSSLKVGRYMPRDDAKYVHVHDMRELGRYIHIPFPYNGGYGPYTGHNIPYEYDPTGEYSIAKYQTVSTPFSFDPFKTNEYTIPIPEICLQYGFPQFPLYQAGTPREPNSETPLNRKPFEPLNHHHPTPPNDVNSIFTEYGDKQHSFIIEKRESSEVDADEKEIKGDTLVPENHQSFDAQNVQSEAPVLENHNLETPNSNSKTEKNDDSNLEIKKVEAHEEEQNSHAENSPDEVSKSDSETIEKENSATEKSETNKSNDENSQLPQNLDSQNLNNQNLDNQNLDNKNSDSEESEKEFSDPENAKHIRVRKSIFNYSQTKVPRPITTARPRTRYDDEGKWKIIRQKEKKQKMNYEYLYETENGILAQEKAVVNKQSNDKDGTNGYGFYQYPGDDGKIYRVEYTVGEQGFIPKGDHLPKALQQSLEIQRRLHQNHL